jgi:hypothetical protein
MNMPFPEVPIHQTPESLIHVVDSCPQVAYVAVADGQCQVNPLVLQKRGILVQGSVDLTAVPQGFPPLADWAATMLAVPSVEESAVGLV